MPLINCAGMRTEINKKRGTPSKRSEEARAKGAKRGKNNWVVGRGGPVRGPAPPPPPRKRGPGAFLRFIITKNAIYLQEMQDIPGR